MRKGVTGDVAGASVLGMTGGVTGDGSLSHFNVTENRPNVTKLRDALVSP